MQRGERESLRVQLLRHAKPPPPSSGYAPRVTQASLMRLNLLIAAAVATLIALFFLHARDADLASDNRTNPRTKSDIDISSCKHLVWVIRHGEKTLNPAPGSREVLELNATGFRRAQYLKSLVVKHDWPQFTHVFASSTSPPGAALREMQTVEPLASTLDLSVDLRFAQEETDALAKAALDAAHASTCGGSVLISWEHCRIPLLLSALGCDRTECSRCWADGVYDSVVVLGFDKEAGKVSATLRREGFADDVLGYEGYQCARLDRERVGHCRFPNGTWL